MYEAALHRMETSAHRITPLFFIELLSGVCLSVFLFIGIGWPDEGITSTHKQIPVSWSAGLQDFGLPAINWQISPHAIKGLQKIESDPAFGGIDQYTPSGRPLVFGNAILDGLVFGFWQGQLYSITLWADSQAGYNSLRKEVFGRYGRGKQSIIDPECFVWDGRDTQRMLKYDTKHQTAVFTMRSTLVDMHIKQLYPSE
jgi:hypothetical protein